MSSYLSNYQRDIDIIVRVASYWGLQLNSGKFSVKRFTCKNSFIERLDIAQFKGYYVRRVGFPFVDSFEDLGIIVDTKLKFHEHISSIVGRSSRISVNLLNSTL